MKCHLCILDQSPPWIRNQPWVIFYFYQMGNSQCKDFCNNGDKAEIVHIEVIPASDVSEWEKEEQKTALPQPFKVAGRASVVSMSNQPKVDTSYNDDNKSNLSEASDIGLPPIEILKEQNHYIVPHDLVVSRVSSKTQLLMKKEFPTSPLMQDDARWYLLTSGNYYNGDLADEQPFGIGTYLLPDKVFYGETENKRPHGMGVIIGDQYIFKGEFQSGKAERDGTLESQNYNAKGMFVGGKMKSGKIITKTYVYEGSFLDNQPGGKGFYHDTTNKVTYEGEFLNGKFHGRGKYTCQQYSYEGEFMNGMKDGRGCLEEFKRGRKVNGIWAEDQVQMIL